MDLTIDRSSRSYLDFLQGIKKSTRSDVTAAIRSRYETRVAETGAQPATYREVGDLLQGELVYSHYGLLSRWSQEQMWAEIHRIIDANRDVVEAELRSRRGDADGSLMLDPDLELPRYYTAVEFHLRPGGMWDGETQGLLTHLADAVYGRGENDQHQAQRWAAQHIPTPKSMDGGGTARVLDLACGIGKATWPLVQRFPLAEAHGCDLSAPLLTFMHGEAAERGVAVHLKQANAESTGYPDAWFDVVEAYILFHELPDPAAERVIADVFRILKPGGVFALADIRSYERQGPFNAFLSDWQTRHNEETYWRSHCTRDYFRLFRDAGFVDVSAADSPVNRNSMLYLAHKPGDDGPR